MIGIILYAHLAGPTGSTIEGWLWTAFFVSAGAVTALCTWIRKRNRDE